MAVYLNIYSSLVKFINDFAEEITTDPDIVVPLNFMNWDSRGEIHDLKRLDYIGPAAFSVTNDDGLQMVDVHIGLSCVDDKNNFRHHKIFDRLYTRCTAGVKVPVYDSESGIQVGSFTFTGTSQILPMLQTQIRPLQYLHVSLGVDLSVSS